MNTHAPIPFVDLKSQYLSIKKEMDEAIQGVLEETSFIGGKHVKEFEQKFAQAYGVKNCVSCANGTDAIYIIMKMLGIGSGDEVITTACSWISTSETISQTGATPVFVDIERDYFTIDPRLIESKINSKTKAIIPVHLYGQIADVEAIGKICRKYNLYLIEDCAQSHFSEQDGIRAGLRGIAATFSYYPGKNLGAYGDAGALITNDDAFAQKCKMYANHGALVKHQHQIEGINSRLDGLQAAVLNVKLPHIAKWTEARIRCAELYNQYLKNINQICLPKVRENSKHTFHLYVIRTEKRDELAQWLKQNGIETALHYPTPLPFLPAYKYLNASEADFPVALEYQKSILSLPIFPELTEDSIKRIADCIQDFFQKN